MQRLAAGGIASVGWFSLGLQLYLAIDGALARGVPVAGAITAYFSFFTILTNLLIAACLSLAAVAPDLAHFWNRPTVQSALALYIVTVALVYAAVLQGLWNPQGLRHVTDRLLHEVLPALYLGYWLLLTPKGVL